MYHLQNKVKTLQNYCVVHYTEPLWND